MRMVLVIAATTSLAVGSSFAQNTKSPEPEDPGKKALPHINYDSLDAKPGPPAIDTIEGNNPGAPASGANSFTENQAKSRIEERGFANVSELTKDDQGVWRGTAERDGKKVQVMLDFQGNVVTN
jgi:hypothetical protein